ncbi:MAG: type I glyceraldehyde-3-phosphate dehydrogenase [Deltaproteobacteria bacterium]|nr:type I glyceraldehyde-3-phosphate dehydrogenase [Deltaproteobacteria bacterium]
MTVKVAINGYGRIGRCIHRRILELGNACGLELAAINDITSTETLAHLFKYDSVHRTAPHDVRTDGESLVVDGKSVPVLAERDPASLPWAKLDVGIIFECTGLFRTKELASKHVEAGARKVILSAPGKGVDQTIVFGVNNASYDPGAHTVISNASCTTNCLVPVVKVINETFGIETAQMTTIHSYTNGQRILDTPHKDLRRARAAAVSMIPTTTGAARAVTLIFPELEGKIDGLSIRVPTPNVSIVELTAHVQKPATVDSVNAALREAAEGELKGVLAYCDEPLVSVDFMGNPHSSIVDADLTMVIGNDNVKVFSWYDNEWGYSSRMVDLAGYVASKGL